MKARFCFAALILAAGIIAFPEDTSVAASTVSRPQVSINPALASVSPDLVQKVTADRTAAEAAKAAAEKAAAEQAWYKAMAEQAWYAGVQAAIEQQSFVPTTRVQSAPHRTARAPVAPSSAKQSGTGRCGGSLPPCSVMMCESGGSLTARNASGASGKWQIMPGTWAGYGGYSSAAAAPESVQDERAAQIYAGGAGRGNWVC